MNTKNSGAAPNRGLVTLVGAGPGDAGLLTAKGRAAIESADVVVYDRLVGGEILSLIPDNAEKIDVGKISSYHKIPQAEINKILLDKALEGKNVVRLKGGDPFLFGRGGEELELLAANGIDFCVVPGITSALAVPAYAGIPPTHRQYASSVHIFTAHKKHDEPLDIDFKSCVSIGGTLIFLMGVANLSQIVQGLTNAGMDKNMPCAVIENGTMPQQKKTVGCLYDIESLCGGVKSPAVIIVGEVCGLSDRFDTFDRLPLKGVRIAVTRPAERQGTLCAKLRDLGADVKSMPCIRTESIIDDNIMNKVLDKLAENTVIVFTSAAGVSAVFNALKARRKDGRVFGGCRFACIGGGTAAELEKYGFFADIMPDEYSCRELGKELVRQFDGGNMLLLRAKNASADLNEELEKGGIKYDEIAVYRTEYITYEIGGEKEAVSDYKLSTGDNDTANLGTLGSGDSVGDSQEVFNPKSIKNTDNEFNFDYVVFTSASTVRAFAASTAVRNFVGICIGGKTAAEAERYGITAAVSERADIDGIVEVICREAAGCRI